MIRNLADILGIGLTLGVVGSLTCGARQIDWNHNPGARLLSYEESQRELKSDEPRPLGPLTQQKRLDEYIQELNEGGQSHGFDYDTVFVRIEQFEGHPWGEPREVERTRTQVRIFPGTIDGEINTRIPEGCYGPIRPDESFIDLDWGDSKTIYYTPDGTPQPNQEVFYVRRKVDPLRPWVELDEFETVVTDSDTYNKIFPSEKEPHPFDGEIKFGSYQERNIGPLGECGLPFENRTHEFFPGIN